MYQFNILDNSICWILSLFVGSIVIIYLLKFTLDLLGLKNILEYNLHTGIEWSNYYSPDDESKGQ